LSHTPPCVLFIYAKMNEAFLKSFIHSFISG